VGNGGGEAMKERDAPFNHSSINQRDVESEEKEDMYRKEGRRKA